MKSSPTADSGSTPERAAVAERTPVAVARDSGQWQFALEFVRTKGRLPENELEMADWLLEFDEQLWNAMSMILDNYDQHMLLCRGVVELGKGPAS